MFLPSGKVFIAGAFLLAAPAVRGQEAFAQEEIEEERYLRALDSGSFAERYQAIRQLGELGSTRALPRLLQLLVIEGSIPGRALEDDGKEIRWAIDMAIAVHPDPSIEKFMEVLENAGVEE